MRRPSRSGSRPNSSERRPIGPTRGGRLSFASQRSSRLTEIGIASTQWPPSKTEPVKRGYEVLRAGSQGRSPDSWRKAKALAHARHGRGDLLEAQIQRHLADAGVGRSWAKELVERLWYLGVEHVEPELAEALAKDFALVQKLTIGITARHDAGRDPRARDRATGREAHFDGALGDGPHQLARQAVEALQLGPRPWELPVGTQLTISDSWTPHPARKTAFLRDRLRVPQSHLEPEDPEVAALLQLLDALAIPGRPDGGRRHRSTRRSCPDHGRSSRTKSPRAGRGRAQGRRRRDPPPRLAPPALVRRPTRRLGRRPVGQSAFSGTGERCVKANDLTDFVL